MKLLSYILLILFTCFSCTVKKEDTKYFNDVLFSEWHKEVINSLDNAKNIDSCKKYLKEEFIKINVFKKRKNALDTILKKYGTEISSIYKFEVSESTHINSTFGFDIRFNDNDTYYSCGSLGREITYVSSNKRLLFDEPCGELNCNDFSFDGLIDIHTKFERQGLNEEFKIKEICISFVTRNSSG